MTIRWASWGRLKGIAMHHRFIRGVAAAALLLVAGATSAQDFSAQRLSDEIRIISADDFQGRYPGTEGEKKTLDWLQAQYEAMGMEPGGPDGQWLQVIDLKRLTPTGQPTLSWSGATSQRRALVAGTDFTLRAMNAAAAGKVADAPVVFAGYGIHAPERGWDDYGDLDVTGAIVLVVAGEPDGELFNGPYATNYQSAAYKADEAKRRGAAAVLTIIDGDAGAAAWRRETSGATRTRTLTPGSAELTLSGAVNRDAAAEMGVDLATLKPRLQTGDFRAFPLDVRITAAAEETVEILRTHNLLARITGSERPNEVIIYSAHWDHVGVNEDTAGDDKIFNGAWDNASGTIGVVEMARQLKAAPTPKRSIVFAHMAAEEMGLLGAYAYVADPVYPLETTVADINIDMLPLSGPTRDVPIFGKGQNSLEDDLQALAEKEGRYVSDDGQPEQNFYYRSDHFPFARAGVPALMPWHGVDWVEGGREAGLAAWKAKFAADYHRPSDEWSADWDLRSAVENLTLLYRLGLELANGDGWPTWKPTSEFGQVRDRSAAARR
ncbi:M28 family peptidase [Brevundimonas diminuta]|uniref:M28 family peptidase n=1 Tax=Brevundimonas diminuta TaxID=293 RepID=UPI0020983E09|nr:M28 family peptidase [Brevundimonas diminuta]MCO8017312.1 M28 family peptidase [Brevundimonas diminuta]MCO8020832.1 M28 family peptidase [Brevundimonas diminuta]